MNQKYCRVGVTLCSVVMCLSTECSDRHSAVQYPVQNTNIYHSMTVFLLAAIC